MNFIDPIFIILMASSVLYIITGVMLYRKPPKTINPVYGYRTKASMDSQQRWDFAQTTAGVEKIKTGIVMAMLASMSLYMEWPEAIEIFLGLAMMALLSYMPQFVTERAILKEFGVVEESQEKPE